MNKLVRTTLGLGLITFVAGTTSVSAGTLKVMFAGQTNNPVVNKVVEEYQRSHKGTKVEPIFMDYQDQAAAIEKKPDVFVGPNYFLRDNLDIGLFEDLSKILPSASLSDIHPGLLSGYSLGKKLYGVPVIGFNSQMTYNKILFKQVGLADPDLSWTWQGKFYEACRKLSRDTNGDGVMEYCGILGGNRGNFSPVIYGYGGDFTDKAFKKVLYTSKPAIDAVNFLAKIHQEKLVEIYDNTSFQNGKLPTYPFYNGKSGMIMDFGSQLDVKQANEYFKKQNLNLEVGSSIIPAGPKGAIPLVDSYVVNLMVTCKNKKDAAEFIKYMLTTKGQLMFYDAFHTLPTTISGLSLAKVTKNLPSPYLKAYRNGKARSIRRQAYAIENTLWGDLEKIATGEGTLKDLMENAKTSAAQMLSQVM